MMLGNFFYFIGNFLGSYPFILFASSLSLGLKAFILIFLAMRGIQSSTTRRPWLFLLIVLIAAMVSNLAWIIKSIQMTIFPTMDYRIVLFMLRIAWGFSVIQYQALVLFVESLLKQNYVIGMRQKISIVLSTVLALPFFVIAFLHCNNQTIAERPILELKLMQIEPWYTIFFLALPGLIFAIYKMRQVNLPRILRKQLKLFIILLICPYVLFDFIQLWPFNKLPFLLAANNLSVVGISTTLLTLAIYFCTKKMMGLRFLNFQTHVQSNNRFNFIDDFKYVLEQLGHATNHSELLHITRTFFKDAFGLPINRTRLYIRKLRNETNTGPHYLEDMGRRETTIENFLSVHDPNGPLMKQLRRTKILINDEIEFSNFYEEHDASNTFMSFLEDINADVFLPIYEKKMIIGYILIESQAREAFYSDIERDEMVVFASYLSNIINLLQHRSLTVVVKRDKEIQEELYNKHQEINQYKESIRSFLRGTQERDIGIIFYKNRHFVFGNQSAKEMVSVNINTQDGHPMTQTIKNLVRQVETYKAPQIKNVLNPQGKKIVLSAFYNAEHNNVVLTVYYPELSDVLRKQVSLLNDPTQWDYLLYLETTQTGKLINQLIPGSGEHLLNFKISLLQTALSRKAVLLEMPDADLHSTVELLHHVSLRETLHVLKLNGPVKNLDTAIALFGINPIFGLSKGQPLLKKLDTVGTLHIQNIHYLDRESQEYLAEYLKYGFFHTFKTDQRFTTDVRIICSTNQNLYTLVQEEKFSQSLFDELKKTTLQLPSLISLPKEELSALTDGFTEQALATPDLKKFLELTDKEKDKLTDTDKRPASLQEFKTKVQQILVRKSKQSNIYDETQFDPAYDISDPELIQVSRLGKKALRDPQALALLWNKFKNQNKIATFLGVNRSSVNRRCKEYNLT